MIETRPLDNALILVAILLAGCAAPTTHTPATHTPATHTPATHTPATQPTPTTTPIAADPDAPSPQDLAQEAKLDQHLPELRYDAVPLIQVFDDFRNRSGANIIVDWTALTNAGCGKGAPVTARLRDIKLSKALQLVFKSVEGEDDDHKLAYCLSDGKVLVTSNQAIKKLIVTRAYDISFLFAGATPSTNPTDLANRVTEIENYVTDNVDSTTWKNNGGDLGEISLDDKRCVLTVTHLPSSQRKVRAVLDAVCQSGIQPQVQQFPTLSPPTTQR